MSYTITLLKKGEVIFHSENNPIEVAIILYLGFNEYSDRTMNFHISQFIDGKINESFSLSELGI